MNKEMEQKILEIINNNSDYHFKHINDKNNNNESLLVFYMVHCEELEEEKKLTRNQIDYLIENSDLTNGNTLMTAFCTNSHVKLSKKQLNYIMKHVNLADEDEDGNIPLEYAILFNKSEKLNLNEKQWDFLLQNSDLNHRDAVEGKPILFDYLKYKGIEKIKLLPHQIKLLEDTVQFIDDDHIEYYAEENFYFELKAIKQKYDLEKRINKKKKATKKIKL